MVKGLPTLGARLSGRRARSLHRRYTCIVEIGGYDRTEGAHAQALSTDALVTDVFPACPGGCRAAPPCKHLVATGNPEYPPYLWRDPQNPQRLIGANADLLQRLGSELGLEIDVVYGGPWSRAQEQVKSGRIDLIAGAFRTASREVTMDFIPRRS